ncbi:MAG: peptide chain release factor N(5)-glutamine methyltransferase [Deltaproteobacteria bacterium HGW-Deltaproteobacteria-6]|jgi:release factor glutamine methyltransferase|nr:MAG: peptide chain release factor N(5)-glutamine methyltransferase [Deltaproteobacteria bacterium HGW-Deltaproteobacteria-6]
MTMRDIIAKATQKLDSAGIPSARLDAEVLLAFCLECDRMEFIKNPDRIIGGTQLKAFHQLIERRLRFEPVAYITGRKAFWSLTLDVNPDVLIPRPDTEVLVEEALAVFQTEAFHHPRILDIGTGSGAIALALACEIPEAKVTATDISEAALAAAQRNAAALGLANSITFLPGDLFEPVCGEFDIIVSNPPYIGATEYETLEAGVKDFEPKLALWAGQTGLEFYKKLIYQAHSHLAENGWLLLEIGAKQSESVRAIMSANAGFYDHIDVRADYAGLSRVIKGRRK